MICGGLPDAIKEFLTLNVNNTRGIQSEIYRYYKDDIKETWGKYLDNNHFKVVTLNELATQIVSAIVESSNSVIGETGACTSTDGISW